MSRPSSHSGERLTAADEALIRRLAEHGYDVGHWQLKRWRGAGLLASPVQQSMGRGRGRPSGAYPPEAFDQALDIARCVQHRIPLRYVPLSMFAQQIPVRPELVTQAYVDFLDDFEAEQGEGDPSDRGDAAAQRLRPRMKRNSWGRAWIRRSGEYGARRSSQLEGVLVAVFGVLLAGEEPSEEAKTATPVIVGAPEGAANELYEQLEKMSVPALWDVAASADFEELRTALAALRRITDLAALWHQMQEAVGSTPLGAGLADIDLRARDPAWQAIDALAVAAALRATPALLDFLTSMEEVTRRALDGVGFGDDTVN